MKKLNTASSPRPMLQDVDPKVRKIDVLPRHSVGLKVWMLHRITGVGLLLYLFAHIGTMSTAMFLGDAAFKRTFEILFHTPIFVFFDILILAALVFHGLNGVRIVLMEAGLWVTRRKHKAALIVTISLIVIVFTWLFTRAFI